MIPFAEWLPDMEDLNNPGATVAKNCRPHARGYRPLPTLSTFSEALTARPRGGIYARDASNNVYTYVGDETSIYSLSSAAWTDVSRTASAYTCGAEDYWEFVKWNENVIGTNFANEMQKIALGGSNFADLAGGPPKARHITTVRNFVVVGNTNDSTDGNVPHRVRWSAADNEESWTVSASTQADYEDLYGNGGWINRVFGGEYGVVFQETSVWRMTYVGSPAIFAFDEVLPGRGLLTPGGAAQHGDMIFGLSRDGFFLLANGSQVHEIGANKVDRYVLGDIDVEYLDRVKSGIDAVNKMFYMIYPGVANSGGIPNRLVIYDWSVQRWSLAELDLHLLLTSDTPGVTLDALDSISNSIDALSVSLDDDVWKGGAPQMAAFNSDMEMAFFTGSPMTATIETTETQLSKGRRTMLTAVRPLVDGGTTKVQVARRQMQSEGPVWSGTANVNANGRATLRSNARYHRVRVNISGEWSHAQGVEVSGSPVGWR